MATQNLNLAFDRTPLEEALSELQFLTNGLDLTPEVRNGLLGLVKAPLETGIAKLDASTTLIADQIMVRLEPGHGLLRLLAAARAGNVDLAVIEEIRHGASPVVAESEPATIGDSGPGVMPGPDDKGDAT